MLSTFFSSSDSPTKSKKNSRNSSPKSRPGSPNRRRFNKIELPKHLCGSYAVFQKKIFTEENFSAFQLDDPEEILREKKENKNSEISQEGGDPLAHLGLLNFENFQTAILNSFVVTKEKKIVYAIHEMPSFRDLNFPFKPQLSYFLTFFYEYFLNKLKVTNLKQEKFLKNYKKFVNCQKFKLFLEDCFWFIFCSAFAKKESRILLGFLMTKILSNLPKLLVRKSDKFVNLVLVLSIETICKFIRTTFTQKDKVTQSYISVLTSKALVYFCYRLLFELVYGVPLNDEFLQNLREIFINENDFEKNEISDSGNLEFLPNDHFESVLTEKTNLVPKSKKEKLVQFEIFQLSALQKGGQEMLNRKKMKLKKRPITIGRRN